MRPSSISFRDLLPLIENDFLMVRGSEYPRGRLYYTVRINGRTPHVSTRILMGDNNRTRISFMICTPVDDTQTSLYLSEIDIIDIIYRLEAELYEHLMNTLGKVFRGEIETTGHSIVIKRGRLTDGIVSFSQIATTGIVLLPVVEHQSVKTPFGITFSYKTFCDFLSLSLSTEDNEKLKCVAVKYYVISHIIRNEVGEMPVPAQLQQLGTLQQVKSFYAKLGVTKSLELDKAMFNYDNYADYFQTQ